MKRASFRMNSLGLLRGRGRMLLAVAPVIIGLGAASVISQTGSTQAVQAPLFEVDAQWPKPLPNHWLLGSVLGLAVDARDHVFVIMDTANFVPRTETGSGYMGRGARHPITPPGECCSAAPNVLEFDADGNLVANWKPGTGSFAWPTLNHGISVDRQGNVWIGGSGNNDSHILKFSRDGRFIAQFGTPAAKEGSQSKTNFGGVAEISFDPANANQAYVADGYVNRRIAVIDVSNGSIVRQWGAYGKAPDDADIGRYDPAAPPAQQFRTPHCVEPSTDGMLYVCDRGNNRIQVFRKDGTFVKEKVIAPNTRGDGSVWDIAFSRDPQQRFLYVADGMNQRVHILDRQSLEHLTSFGAGGRYPGHFFSIHNIAVDSRGNIYTGESLQGKRIQKFVFKGIGAVTKKDQGALWPAR